MAVKVKVDMKPVNTIIARLGLNETGDVQKQVTGIINHRITRYMPYRSSALATKTKFVAKGDPRHLSEEKKHITSPTTIIVEGPYAAYQYYGKVMVGKAPKVATDKPLTYSRHKNPLAGPKWDKRLMAAEGAQIAHEIQTYIDRKAGKR